MGCRAGPRNLGLWQAAQLSAVGGGLIVSRFRGFLKRKIRDWMAPIKPESAADRLTFREQLVGRFVQMPLGALSIWQMSNQLSGKLVNIDAFEVVKLLSLQIEDSRTKDDRYMDATAVEYFSVHGWPPLRWPHPGRLDKLR